MKIGYKLSTEGHDPKEIVRQAVLAEQAGFDFVEASDHFHPWLPLQGHSANTWVLFGHIAAKTERVGIVTGVTCPSFRYHPAIVAQMSATLQIISDGRHTLGVGSGERLNEHVVGKHFGGVQQRHEAFREALEIIRLLWSGGYHSYEGKHLQLEDARVFDLPEALPEICVAVSGPKSLQIAIDLGDGLFATEPKRELVQGFADAGKSGPAYVETPHAWAKTEGEAMDAMLQKGRFAVTGWKVLSELPNPVNFDAATQSVGPDDIAAMFAVGPDVERHLAVVQPFVDAGFDHIVPQVSGPDPDGYLEFFANEFGPRLRAMTPATSSA